MVEDGFKFGITNKRRSEWISELVGSKFYDSCDDHPDRRKNEKNVFCVHCSDCLCKHCVSSSDHHFHTLIQICKYVYHDVVRLQDIQKLFDCSEIQTYKINGKKAIHLNPRPQYNKNSISKPSTETKCGASCEACGRYIKDKPSCFCSIACKVFIVPEEKTETSSSPISEVRNLNPKEESTPNGNILMNEKTISSAESLIEVKASVKSESMPKSKLHRRKGVPPYRAPLF